jgi:hypothetical protein
MNKLVNTSFPGTNSLCRVCEFVSILCVHISFSLLVSQFYNRSQRPRSLRHELFSRAQTLGSWVRIPLKAWMSMHVCSVQVVTLRRADPLSNEFCRLRIKLTN